MRLVIVHYHIFKNAGSTIEDILDHSFGDRFARLDTPVGGGLISNEELLSFLDARPHVSAFSSHQIRHPLPQAPSYLFFDICFLRDPIDRIRSIYTYFRKRPNPDDPMSALANGASLGDFAAGMIRDFSLFTQNVQVNLLACAGDSDEPEPRDLEVAIQRMMATSFLGVVDCFDQSVVAGTHALRRVFPELDYHQPPANVSDGLEGSVASRSEKLRQACTPAVYEELLRMNQLDRQLVDRARAEVLRRFVEVPPAQPQVLSKQPHAGPQSGFAGVARRFVSLAPCWRELSGSARKPVFDADFYRAAPLFDFPAQRTQQGYRACPPFAPAFYLRKYPDVAAARLNPLLHYLRHGAAEDRKPSPLFEPGHYRSTCPEAPPSGPHQLAHFLESGAQAASPHPLFDCAAYREAHPEIVAQGLNPLVHYLLPASAAAGGPMPAEPASLARLEIQDVPVTVVCLDADPGARAAALHEEWKRWAAGQGIPGSVALLWPDACGLARWLAEPQQQPFLQSLRLDQIRAQMKLAPAEK